MNLIHATSKHPLEVQAYIVWCGALTGRQFARSDDPDTRLRAYERMRHLERIENERFPSLTRIAASAARDINQMLNLHEREVG